MKRNVGVSGKTFITIKTRHTLMRYPVSVIIVLLLEEEVSDDPPSLEERSVDGGQIWSKRLTGAEQANKLERRPQPPFCCPQQIWDRRHFNFGKTATVALMFLITPLGEMLEFLL